MDLAVGQWAVVPWGKSRRVGIVESLSDTCELAPEKLRDVEQLLPELPPLAPQWLEFIRFAAGYYQGEAAELGLGSVPKLLRVPPSPRTRKRADARLAAFDPGASRSPRPRPRGAGAGHARAAGAAGDADGRHRCPRPGRCLVGRRCLWRRCCNPYRGQARAAALAVAWRHRQWQDRGLCPLVPIPARSRSGSPGAAAGAGDRPDTLAAWSAAPALSRRPDRGPAQRDARRDAGQQLDGRGHRPCPHRPGYPPRGARAGSAAWQRSSSTRNTTRRSSSRRASAIRRATWRSRVRPSRGCRSCSARRRRRWRAGATPGPAATGCCS